MRTGSVLLLSEDKAPAAAVDDEVSSTRQSQYNGASHNVSVLANSV